MAIIGNIPHFQTYPFWFRSENCTQRDQQSTKGQAKLLMARTQLAGRWATAAQYVTLLMQLATWAKNWRRGDCSIPFLNLKHVYIYILIIMIVVCMFCQIEKASEKVPLRNFSFVRCSRVSQQTIESLCAYTASQHSTNQQNGCGMPEHHSSKQWQNLSSTALSDCCDAAVILHHALRQRLLPPESNQWPPQGCQAVFWWPLCKWLAQYFLRHPKTVRNGTVDEVETSRWSLSSKMIQFSHSHQSSISHQSSLQLESEADPAIQGQNNLRQTMTNPVVSCSWLCIGFFRELAGS